MRRRETREGTTCDGYQKAVRRREKWKKALHMRRENQSSVRRGYAWHGVEPASQVRVPYVRGLLWLERANITISREDPRTITTYLGYIVHWRGLLDDEIEGLPLLEQTSWNDSLPSVHDAWEVWRLIVQQHGEGDARLRERSTWESHGVARGGPEAGRRGLRRDGTTCPPMLALRPPWLMAIRG
jgi:hypothetical protein